MLGHEKNKVLFDIKMSFWFKSTNITKTFRIILIALSGVDTSSSYLTRRILPGKELAKFEASTMSMNRSEHSLVLVYVNKIINPGFMNNTFQ